MPELATISPIETGAKVHPDLTGGTGRMGDNKPGKEDMIFAIGQMDAADATVKEANSARKKVRQHFKNRGFNLDMLDRARDERDKNDGTTLENLKEFKQYCEWLDLPTGFQIGLFDGNASASAKADLTEAAYQDGFARGLLAADPDSQKWLPNSPEGQAHLRGWNDGQKVLKDKFEEMNASIAEENKTPEQKATEKAAAKEQKEKDKRDKAAERAKEREAELKAKQDAKAAAKEAAKEAAPPDEPTSPDEQAPADTEEAA